MVQHVHAVVEGDRGAGARENRGREGYGRRERKGREAGVLRGREAGEQYKTVNFFNINALEYYQKKNSTMLYNVICLTYSVLRGFTQYFISEGTRKFVLRR